MKLTRGELSVYEVLNYTSEKFGGKEAIVDKRHRKSFINLKEDVDRIAAFFNNRGIKKGDRIASSLPNWYEAVVIMFSAAKLGAILVPLNPKYKKEELGHILCNSKPKLIFISEEFKKNINLNEFTKESIETYTVRFEWGNLTSFNLILKKDYENVNAEKIKTNEDIFCILYTSGTTGVPKGVMIPHRGIVQSGDTFGSGLHCTDRDIFIVLAPLFHVFGMIVNLFCALLVGAKSVLMEKFRTNEVLETIEKEKITILHGVPTMFIQILADENFENTDLSSLRTGISGAAPITPVKLKEIRKKMNINLLQAFGITETSAVTLTPYDGDEEKILKTLGKPMPGVEMKIVDENRNEVSLNEEGEIAIRSVGNLKGYYKMPEETAKVLDEDGWYYSGDFGLFDKDGYLHYIGRKKEIIIRGGFNIYPQEVEAVLAKHPKVSDSAVIGLPDEILGEKVCAVIIFKTNQNVSEENIKAYLKEQLANFKVPEKVVYVDNFPKTASGKTQKKQLKKEILS